MSIRIMGALMSLNGKLPDWLLKQDLAPTSTSIHGYQMALEHPDISIDNFRTHYEELHLSADVPRHVQTHMDLLAHAPVLAATEDGDEHREIRDANGIWFVASNEIATLFELRGAGREAGETFEDLAEQVAVIRAKTRAPLLPMTAIVENVSVKLG